MSCVGASGATRCAASRPALRGSEKHSRLAARQRLLHFFSPSRPESGIDCLTCAGSARQRTSHVYIYIHMGHVYIYIYTYGGLHTFTEISKSAETFTRSRKSQRAQRPGHGVECAVRHRGLQLLLITLEPRVELCKSLCAFDTSPPRNRCTFLRSSRQRCGADQKSHLPHLPGQETLQGYLAHEKPLPPLGPP